jgi:hypothetical protein
MVAGWETDECEFFMRCWWPRRTPMLPSIKLWGNGPFGDSIGHLYTQGNARLFETAP